MDEARGGLNVTNGGGGQREERELDRADPHVAKEHGPPTDSFKERIHWHLQVNGNFGGIEPPNFNLY